MLTQNQELPKLNCLWVGPPKAIIIDESTNAEILGSDTKYVIEMSQKCQNQICYYCLGDHVDYYQKLFSAKNVNIQVESIEAYIEQMQNHGDDDIRKHAHKMVEIKNELLKPPRDRIYDRVLLKNAFSLFLLATQGGYTMDTSIRIKGGNNDISFGEYEHFTCPYYKQYTVNVPDWWMMYASSKTLEEPKKILRIYLENWDKKQKIIRGKEKDIDSICDFHDEMTSLMASSIQVVLSLIDSKKRWNLDWEFIISVPNEKEQAGIAFIGNLFKLSIEKLYGNSHKPEYECREIVKNDVNEYYNKKQTLFFNLDERKDLLENLRDSLKLYDLDNSIKEKLKVNNNEANLKIMHILSININELLKSVKKVDEYIIKKQLPTFYESKIDENKKSAIDAEINSIYKELNLKLNQFVKNSEIYSKYKDEEIQKIVKDFKKNMKEISTQVSDSNQSQKKKLSL